MDDIHHIASQFDKHVTAITEVSGGHINKTYKVSGSVPFILQEINTRIFKTPENLFSNLQVIESELLAVDYPYEVVGAIPSLGGEGVVYDGKLAYRALSFVDGHQRLQASPEMNRITGVAFAHFTRSLMHTDPSAIAHTIPDFHNPDLRFEQFMSSTENTERSGVSQSLIDHGLALSMILKEHEDTRSDLPLRITHNDAKLGNVLFHNSGEVAAIVDLDTVMPGYIMHDFGDMARSMCSAVEEDSREKATFDLKMFAALSKGYLSVIEPELTDAEIISLITGTKTMIYTQFLRFLSDYLAGDTYYRTSYSEHNLDRAGNQLQLLLDFLEKQDQCAVILEKLVNG